MIKNFADKETEKIYNGKFSKKLPQDIQKRALIKLIMMNNSNNINDLRNPPANHLEKLSGDREGQYSIAINNQYRICFKLKNENDFHDVEIVDYH
ncbi:MAG: type II toxin-antitoxin system RelE/ParE family toxin [Liquorilactobacillus hordei]|uniref:type II toxin-antitoxin system RelE/ParE family toxin n=1 Tax=Liquorilactobacillus hordei TaxID=468911 RepID=UPI0039E8DC15